MHMLICDDDARFAARVEQLVRACLGQREIPAEIVERSNAFGISRYRITEEYLP